MFVCGGTESHSVLSINRVTGLVRGLHFRPAPWYGFLLSVHFEVNLAHYLLHRAFHHERAMLAAFVVLALSRCCQVLVAASAGQRILVAWYM